MADHPSQDELSGFVLGTLAPTSTDSVAEHVEQCTSCQQTVCELDAHKDTLLRGLRRTSPPVDEACQKAVDKAAAIGGRDPQKSTSPDQASAMSISSTPAATAPSRDQFIAALQTSRVLDADQWTALQSVPAVSAAADGQALARALVETKALTKYQATLIYQNKPRALMFGEYLVIDKIGAGGMGQVFKARHRRMKRVVAIKVLAKSAVNSPEAVKRFQREVEAAAKLLHPNIVTAFDAGQQENVHFLVMEYVEGSDLANVVKTQGPLSVDKAIDYTLQAARGLEFAHKKGVVHRDIKPANLLLDTEGTVKILDMGLARLDDALGANAAAHDGLTQSGQVMGTVDYMAPEQALDTRTADAKADVYALGCTLHRLLVGENLYGGETMVQKLLAHREQPIPSLGVKRAEVPSELDEVFHKMVAKRPEDRYQSMREVIEALEKARQAKAPATQAKAAKSKPARSVKPSEPQTKSAGRKPPQKWIIAAAAAGFVFVALGVWLIVKNSQGDVTAAVNATPGTVVVPPPGGSVEVATKPPFQTSDASSSRPSSSLIPPSAARGTYALELNGERGIDFPLNLESRGPLTIEGYHSLDGRQSTVGTLLGTPYLYFAIGQDGGLYATCSVAADTKSLDFKKVTTRRAEIPRDRLVHIAVVWTGTRLSLFADGKLVGSQQTEAGLVKKHQLALGGKTFGRLREIRVSQIARYEGEFTPQVRFEPDADTIALYHFDEGAGEVLRDSSGHGHDGKIVSAKWVRVDNGAIPGPAPSGVIASSPSTGGKITTHLQPEFQQWVKDTQALPADKQLEAASKKLMELNPGFDGQLTGFRGPAGVPGSGVPKIDKGVVTEIGLITDTLTDISPVRAFADLNALKCTGGSPSKGKLTDLSPLAGLPLTNLEIGSNPNLSDLSPLRGMELKSFSADYTAINQRALLELQGMPLAYLNAHADLADLSFVKGMPLEILYVRGSFSDLSPLRGMSLRHLSCGVRSGVTDLSPLKGMPLSIVNMDNAPLFDLSPLVECKDLKTLTVKRTKVTAEQVAALQKALPNCKITWDDPANVSKAWNAPEFQQWVKATQALPADQQLEAVAKKLMELNPGFDGKFTGFSTATTGKSPVIANGAVTELGFVSDQIVDLSPVRAFAGLKMLYCGGSPGRNGRVADLSPLQGLKLINLNCTSTEVADLSPLAGMPLRQLQFDNSRVSDLTPLVGMPLTDLRCFRSKVSDLAPLKGMKLSILYCHETPISDLAPLAGMPLTSLNCSQTQVSDLAPLKGAPLTILWCHDAPALTDLTPLAGLQLNTLHFTPGNITRGIDVIRGMTSLQTFGLKHNTQNTYTAAEFWKRYDAGELSKAATTTNDPAFQQWLKATQALPADQQVDAVSKMLMELNPGFDGKVVHFKNTSGAVARITIVVDNVTDLSPLRALAELTNLKCDGSGIGKGQLKDLSPLEGMKLTTFDCQFNKVSDLSPLKGMRLTSLKCGINQVADLSPLEGMPLTYLNCSSSSVADLSPLKGMPLAHLDCYGTKVADVSPLKGMPLTNLTILYTRVTDLTPLEGMSLTSAGVSVRNIKQGMDVLRRMKSLKTISGRTGTVLTAEEFWKQYDAGEFDKPAANSSEAKQEETGK